MLRFKEFVTEDAKLHTLARSWQKTGQPRAAMTRLAKKAKKGRALDHLHPGAMTVYRGVNQDSVHHKTAGTSWTKSKAVAKKYADGGSVHSLKIGPHTPAVDVNTMLVDAPAHSRRDHEVFIAKGKYKTTKESVR